MIKQCITLEIVRKGHIIVNLCPIDPNSLRQATTDKDKFYQIFDGKIVAEFRKGEDLIICAIGEIRMEE